MWKYHVNDSIVCPVCGFKSKNLRGLEYHSSVRIDEQHQAIYILLHRYSRHVVKIPVLKQLKEYFEIPNEY